MEPGPCPHVTTPASLGGLPCPACAAAQDHADQPLVAPAALTPPETTGSYSERYRGTAWGQPEPEHLPPTPPTEGVQRGSILIYGTALAIAAGLAILGLSMISSPSRPTVPLSAITDYTPSIPPLGTPVTQGGVVDEFVKLVTSRDFTYSVDFTAAFTATEYSNFEVLRLSGTLDARGRDFAGTWRVRAHNENAQVGMMMIDDVGFVRLPEEDWTCLGELSDRTEVSPFGRLKSADDVSYEGIKQDQGYTFHRLRISGGSSIAPWMADDPILRDADVRALVYDVFVTDDGTPSRAEFTARIRVPNGLRKTEIKITGGYHFRGVGQEKRFSRPMAGCGGREVPA